MSDLRALDDAPWLRSGPTARVLALLNGGGEEARVIGGAVRNALLKIPTGDIDIATTSPPDEVIRRAKAAGIKSVPTGIDHGTVTLVVEGHPFEVTTLREDTETYGRKASGGIRPRLGPRRRAARLHHQRSFGGRRRRGARPRRRA
jgi:poly(A) polymerase